MGIRKPGRHRPLVISLLVVGLLAPATALGTECRNYETFPGLSGNCALSGIAQMSAPLGDHHVVIVESGQVEIIDVSDLTAPEVVGLVAGMTTYPEHLGLSGQHAYVSSGSQVQILDLTDPTAPFVAATISLPLSPWAMTARAGLLAAYGAGGLRLFGLADPLAPALMSTFAFADGADLRFIADDRLAILGAGIWILDVGSPMNPTVETAITYPTNQGPDYLHATDVNNAVGFPDRLVYTITEYERYGSSWPFVYEYHLGRVLVDVSDPATPIELAVEFTAHGTVSFLFGGGGPLDRCGDVVLDRGRVFAPLTGDLATLTTLPSSSLVDDGQVAWADGRIALVSADYLLTAMLPTVLTDNNWSLGVGNPYWQQASLKEAEVGESFLCLFVAVDGFEGLRTEAWFFDELGENVIAGCNVCGDDLVAAADVNGRDVFVALDFPYYQVAYTRFDGTAPADFTPLDVPAAIALACGPANLMATFGQGDLHLIDVTDAEAPVVLATWTDPAVQSWVRFEWVGELLLVASTDVLIVYDASDPAAPVRMGESQFDVQWLREAGANRVLVGRDADVVLIDLSAPAEPQIVAQQAEWILGERPVVDGDLAYFLHDPTMVTLATVADLEPVGTLATDNWLHSLHTFEGELVATSITHIGWGALPRQCETVAAPGSPAPAARPSLLATPNPFNPRVDLRFTMPDAGEAGLTIHDLAGRCVATLHHGVLTAGPHQWTWNGRGPDGRSLPSGVYLARLQTGDHVTVSKLALVR